MLLIFCKIIINLIKFHYFAYFPYFEKYSFKKREFFLNNRKLSDYIEKLIMNNTNRKNQLDFHLKLDPL